MVTKEENDLLTQTGPGTPCGELMRRYWQPVALSEELPMGGAPLPVRLLGEDLVLFRPASSGRPDPSGRDDQAQPGLLGLHCSHRGADLSYGRLEDGGIRCIYHGWLYDIHGRCLEQPGEPANRNAEFGVRSAESTSPRDPHSAIHNPHSAFSHLAYPCVERGGLIFAYLGPGEPPLLPAYEFLNSRPEFRFVTKYFQECNYLQANEGNLDQTHLSFLHRRLSYRSGESQAYIGQDVSPVLEPEETGFGMRLYSVRRLGPDRINVKISNLLLPNASVFSGGIGNGYSVHFHVPIDDTCHWKFVYHFRRSEPLDERTIEQFRAEMTLDYRLTRTRASRYFQDRDEMKATTFSGMGTFFHAQDACVTEGAGAIQDRTQEHLGYTDRAVLIARQVLLRAIQDVQSGREPPNVIRDEAQNRFPDLVARAEELPAHTDWREYWKAASGQ